MGVFDKFLRAGEGRKIKALRGLVPEIGALEDEVRALDDDALRHKTVEFREQLDRGAELDDLLVDAFAVVREAARRTIGQRHYDVQLMGGAAMHFGWVAEMKTGEGKTLVSTLPVYLNGLSGRGVHLITVNDYLARRDAEWMGQIHNWLGLSIGLVVPGNNNANHKRAQYGCDITYGTNNEFGFDYLRDNMAMRKANQVQRGHVYAIVDEIDSILIDEARTPLIISGKVADAAKLYIQFADIVRRLDRDVDYDVDEEKRHVAPMESGIEKVEQALGVDNLYDEVSSNYVHQLQAALKAKELFHRDKDYIVQDGQVKIVDEFTGRILEGRRWSEGLHQAVEAKERVKIKEENQTLATITLQNYFRLYEKLSGMTGTAQGEAAELAATYGLEVVPIPTNEPVIRVDQSDLIYRSVDAKFNAVVDDIKERHDAGQPVLAGTASVEHSELLGTKLREHGIHHEVLNAKQHHREAEIVAQAGQIGSVTVATNMAGRGVDIILGGNPELLALRDLRADGVQATTVDEVHRRPIELGRRLERLEGADEPDATQIEVVRAEQAEAEEHKQRLDDLTEKYRQQTEVDGKKVRELGGLYVVATERHESRRIDDQLRGRSGRQGDPGESRFYISLEDDLMRLFATGMIDRVMNMALPDDTPIESKMVTKSVERAQNTVEQRNAEIRKNVLKYDQVMNEQRKVIYKRRNQILEGEDLRDDALQALAEAVDAAVSSFCVSDYKEEWDLEGLAADVRQIWPTEVTVEDLRSADTTDELYDRLMGEATGYYEGREAELGEKVMRELERQVMLQIIDQRWREHLYEMDYLQGGINLRAMGQKDPLTEWQREGFDMFTQMMETVSTDFVRHIMHIQVAPKEQAPAEPKVTGITESGPEGTPTEGVGRGAGAAAPAGAGQPAARQPQRPAEPIRKSEMDRVGRNDPCPCGSGKKFKHCHGGAGAPADPAAAAD
ncbi:MAG: preprotein translocase subunit SecA [Actinomycetota bacterium]|nr:preprotein translocase subunit SecA [Actinomycetota bacterium]